MNEPRFLRAEVTLDSADDDTVAEVSRRWLTLGLQHLFPDLSSAAERGEVNAIITTMHGIDDPIYSQPYSPTTWEEALNGLVRLPRATTLDIFRGNTMEGDRLISLSAGHLGATGRWIHLTLDSDVSEEALASRKECEEWVEIMAASLDDADPAHGLISDDYRGIGHTTLDLALNRPRRTSVREARFKLRGYSWVTLCPAQLIESLGGIDRIRGSKAFYQVVPLSAGGAVLQSTETVRQYGDSAMQKVFSVLSPVLPSGMPVPSQAPSGARLIYQNAG